MTIGVHLITDEVPCTQVDRRCSPPDRRTSVPRLSHSVVVLPPAFQDLVDLHAHADDASPPTASLDGLSGLMPWEWLTTAQSFAIYLAHQVGHSTSLLQSFATDLYALSLKRKLAYALSGNLSNSRKSYPTPCLSIVLQFDSITVPSSLSPPRTYLSASFYNRALRASTAMAPMTSSISNRRSVMALWHQCPTTALSLRRIFYFGSSRCMHEHLMLLPTHTP
eukprot:Gb_03021 [translate_table: standard]